MERFKAVLDAMAEAFRTGDFDVIATHLQPDAVADWSRSIGPDRGVYAGLDEIRVFFEGARKHWEAVTWRPIEVVELEGDRLLILAHNTLRGRDGVEVEARGAHVWTLRDGKLARIVIHQNREDAERALADED